MKIGIAGPMTLKLLNFDFGNQSVPEGYPNPVTSLLINALLNKGHQVVAFTTSKDITTPVVFKGENLTICIARNNKHPGRDFFKTARTDLMQLIKEHPIDIINAHWSYEFAWAAIDSGLPHVVTVKDHATTILKYQFDPYRISRWIMNFITLRKAKFLVTNSDYLFDLLGSSAKKKAIVINNFYAKGFDSHISRATEKENYIVSVSNGFGKRKNLETALYAFSLLRKKFPTLEYRLIGHEMEENGPAYSFAEKHNLMDGVAFTGAINFNDVITQIMGAKVFLHPSREESFGMSVLESMLLGTPVIGGIKSGNIPHLLANGKAGELCDVNSPEKIAESVTKIVQDKQYAEKISYEAYNYAKDNFSEERIVTSYLNHYKKILNQ